MSEHGSNARPAQGTVEIFIDEPSDPIEILTGSPFRFQLDATNLSEGAHTVRLVHTDAAGTKRERRIPFTVRHRPTLEVRGIEQGAIVTGNVQVEVLEPSPPPPAARGSRGPSTWLNLLSTAAILGAVWAFFILIPIYRDAAVTPTRSATANVRE